MLHPKLII
jgi:predicted  nucleic acid-binding Zn-ribbon protein